MSENNTAIVAQPRKSILVAMAGRYDMEPEAFEATLRGTIMKADKDGNFATKEEFAAFLVVANEYNLNPLTKEIYAFFDRQRGGIIPIVGVDGWARIINEHKAFNGMSFSDERDDKGNVTSITCRMFRKDREHAIEATEYLAECKRDTTPWKTWPRRMLRHKAMIQAARYAFGFSGIYDQDEAERIAAAGARDVTPPASGTSGIQARLSAANATAPIDIEQHVDRETGEITDRGADPTATDTGEGEDGLATTSPESSVSTLTPEQKGRAAYHAGVTLRQIPNDIKGTDEEPGWIAGWKSSKAEDEPANGGDFPGDRQ